MQTAISGSYFNSISGFELVLDDIKRIIIDVKEGAFSGICGAFFDSVS